MSLSCNLCNSTDRQAVCRKTSSSGQSVEVVRCPRCKLMVIHPFPDSPAIKNLYNGDYFHCPSPVQGGYENYIEDEPNIKKTFLRRWKLLEDRLSKSTKPMAALDIGCATGVFLEILKEKGWNVRGIDVSPFAVNAARAKNLDVAEGNLESVSLRQESFNLITLWDVIEHLEDPLGTLQACHRLLKPGGCLALSTPDASAWLARLLGSYWLGFQSVGEHLYFFTRDTISAMLIRAGFQVLGIHPVGKYLSLDRIITRLCHYTRVFRPLYLLHRLHPHLKLYANSGDTMCVIARKIPAQKVII